MPTRPKETSYPLFGIFGHPMPLTASPAMYNAAFRAHKLPYVYLPFVLERRSGHRLVTLMRLMDIQGANVTAPYKELAVEQVDRLDQSAKIVGAVNTIIQENGKLIGYNTDSAGFLSSLHDARVDLRDQHILIIGAGGAARAVIAAIAMERWQSLTILNRHPEKAKAIADKWNLVDIKTRRCTDTTFSAAAKRSTLIIHASSGSLRSWPITHIGATTTVIDLNYGPLALRSSHRHAFRYIDGTGMLAHQAALAFELFTGRSIPASRFKQAAHRYLRTCSESANHRAI